MRPIKVAVLNTSKEITDMLSDVLEEEGFETCTGFTYHFKKDQSLFNEFIKHHKPDVILYDIALPYQENYFLFTKLSTLEVALKIPFVLTTTNKEVLEGLVGPTNTHELIGKPYDLQEIIDALKTAHTKTIPNVV